jgi:DNA ligase-1
VIKRSQQVFIWSRGEELVFEKYPELVEGTVLLPEGTVLDGEILPWRDDRPLPFSELQHRFGRKTVGKRLLKEVPTAFLAYDVM